MEEQELNNVTSQATEQIDNNQYIEALNQLKANSVDKADYDKLKAENKKLLDSIVNGTEVALPASETESIDELRKKLANSSEDNLSSLEYAETALKLRERLLEEGQEDPFVAHGSQYSPTQLDYDRANRVAAVLQDCVDNAEGDDATFLAELKKRIK
jgi:hypothetical protein